MPKYCSEKFVRVDPAGKGREQTVCWECTKHEHDTKIPEILSLLETTYQGTWEVRKNSFQNGLSTCPAGSIFYEP